MKTSAAFPLVAVCLCCAAPAAPADEAAAAQVLDRLHAAAAQAQFDAYFSLFAPEGVFLGTDAGERWTVPEFKAFAKAHFERGKGWTYRVVGRQVFLSPDGAYAFFDEQLDNASYGRCRGSGALRRINGAWRIVQYHLSIPIPNALAPAVVKLIRAAPR